MNYGLKVSPAGVDVLTATDDQLGFTTKYKTLKIYGAGSVIVNTDSNGNGVSQVAHQMGFAPAFQAWRKNGVDITKRAYTRSNANNVMVSASDDDCDVDLYELFKTGSNIACESNKDVGLKFRDIDIPQGVTVINAYIRMYAGSTESGNPVRARIYGEKAVNVGSFTDRGNFYGKTMTGASVLWDLPNMTQNQAYNTPNLSDIITEIVGQSGWNASDHTMLFEFRRSGTSGGCRRAFYSYDGWVPAELVIYYRTPSLAPNGYFPNPNNLVDEIDDFYQSIVYSDYQYVYFRIAAGIPNNSNIFKYMIFCDQAENYSGSAIGGWQNYGMKVTPDGKDVLTAKLYELGWSSNYYGAKIDKDLSLAFNISLPAINTGNTQTVNYDITHGLTYPPFFMAYGISALVNPTRKLELPFFYMDAVDNPYFRVYGWSDTEKVRITAKRTATPMTGNLGADTVTIKCYVFREDLSLL